MDSWRQIRALLLRAAQLLKVFSFLLWKALTALWFGARKLLLSVRAWILFILLVIGALVAYYVLSDLYTPFTTEAYVQAYVVQVAARVDGQVVRVCVEENKLVEILGPAGGRVQNCRMACHRATWRRV